MCACFFVFIQRLQYRQMLRLMYSLQMNAKLHSCDGENSEVKGDDSESTDEDDQMTSNDEDLNRHINVDKFTYFNNTADEMTSSSVLCGVETRKRNSPVWKYFIYRRTCAVCKLCRTSLKRGMAGNTTNLLKHLQRHHRKQYRAIHKEYSRRKAAEAEARDEVISQSLG